MATNRLYELFSTLDKTDRNLVASPPKSLADMVASGAADVSGLNISMDLAQRVLPKVDYSDFTNFVFFNSALDYFNISGDRMLRSYPYDGTYTDQLSFLSESDGYQSYLIDVWTRWQGAGDFTASLSQSYAYAADVGLVSGNAYAGLLGPGTGSFTVEAHVNIGSLPASGSNAVLIQRSGTSGPTYTVRLTSGSMSLDVSGTTTSVPMTTGSRWFSWVFSRTTSTAGLVSFYTTDPAPGTLAFQGGPYLASSASVSASTLDSGKGALLVCSGSASSPSAPQVQLGELRIWGAAKTQQELFANYNLRVFKDPDLLLYWRFNEGYSGSVNTRVRDYSGHRMDGDLFNTNSSFWVSSSFGMSPQDHGELVLPGDPRKDARLWSYIQLVQASATQYDRDNTNAMTTMVPSQYLQLEDDRNTQVLRNLLYLLGRQFDELKVRIGQISKLMTVNYTQFNQTPDALLGEALKFWGWDTKGSFLSKEAFQHFFGYDVLTPSGSLSGTYAPPVRENNQASYDNQRLDTVLYQIKNEFWKRTLSNLIYLYKTKGTRESVESLLRIYGLDERIVKVKEYGLQPQVGIQTNRIQSEKSAWAYHTSGTMVVSSSATSSVSGAFSLEAQVRFVSGSSSFLSAGNSGSVMYVSSTNYAVDLIYSKNSASSTTGTFAAEVTVSGTSSDFYVSSNLSGGQWPVFDGRWYHVALSVTGTASPTATIEFRHLDDDRIDIYAHGTGSIVAAGPMPVTGFRAGVGSIPGKVQTDQWTRNFQFWNVQTTQVERDDHAFNPFSFGAETPERALDLKINWEFDREYDTAIGQAFDSTINHITGSAIMAGNYERFSYDYNFIAPPDYGWNEEKIRVLSGSEPPVDEHWLESNAVAVEFNLIDALNEDISCMLASMDNWNNLIGEAANRYRPTYPSLDKFRQQYFNRLTGRINFRAFADFLDFFDRSFVELIRRLLPARTNFKGAEFMVESHMLERPKVQFTYRRQSPMLVPEGVITIYSPNLSGSQSTGSAIYA